MYYPDVPALEPDELNLLCNEYMEHNATLDPHLADQMGVKRGLRNLDGTGVLAGITNVSNVIGYDKKPDGTIAPIPGRLVYRGIDIDTLAAEADAHDRFMFEEVIWLLLFGSLPTQEQYAKFRKLLEHHRELPQGFADDMILNSPSPNLMNKMARSVLAMYSYDEHAEDNSLPNILRQSINLIAELPTMMVNAYQIKRRVYDRSSMYFHLPTEGQSTAEHILSTYRADQKFTHEEARLLDLCLLVHADHGGGNCSTFTCRVLSSSGTDTYAAISSAIGALKGPKHGGANLKVMHQLDYILENVEDPTNDDEVREFLRKIIRKERGDGSGLIYGMGHAVYTLSDPRAQILKTHAKSLAYKNGYDEEYEMLCSIERLAPQVFAEEKHGPKKVCANVDLFSGLIYRMLGISEDLFTPLFAIARVPGWCAHRVEEVEFANRIIRPAYQYVGKLASVCGAGREIRYISRCSCKQHFSPQNSLAFPRYFWYSISCFHCNKEIFMPERANKREKRLAMLVVAAVVVVTVLLIVETFRLLLPGLWTRVFRRGRAGPQRLPDQPGAAAQFSDAVVSGRRAGAFAGHSRHAGAAGGGACLWAVARLFDELFRLRRRQHERLLTGPAAGPGHPAAGGRQPQGCEAAGQRAQQQGPLVLHDSGVHHAGAAQRHHPLRRRQRRDAPQAVFGGHLHQPALSHPADLRGRQLYPGGKLDADRAGGRGAVQFCGHSVLQPHPAHRPGAPTQR